MASTILRLVFTGLLLLAPAYAWSLELKSVFENIAVISPARVAFREERHNPMLKEPIILTGYLEYLGPGHLRKVIETPYEEAFLIADDHIEITQDGRSRRLSLGKSKPIRAMLGGIEAILAGQADRLDSLFRYDLSGTQCAWTLQLEPKSKRISAYLTAMLVKGDEKAMTSLRIELKEGEWSLMEILNAEPES
jgi:hypothetical protein